MTALAAGIWPTNLSRNYHDLNVQPLSPAVGAEISGINLPDIKDADFAAIYALWLRYSALLFRDQYLNDEELLKFSSRFGALDVAPVMENGRSAVPGLPEIYVISNIADSAGNPIGSLGSGEAVWHTDMSYLETPPGRVVAIFPRGTKGRR